MKWILATLCLCAAPGLLAQTINLIDLQQPPAGPVQPGTLNHEVLQLRVYRNTGSPPATMTQLRVALTGTAASADWDSIELWFDADGSRDISAGDTQLSSTSVTSAGKATLAGLSEPINEGFSAGRDYLVVVDVAAAATVDRTFVFGMDTSDVTVSGGTVSTPFGPLSSNTHTVRIDTGTEIDVQRNSASIPSSTFAVHDVGYIDASTGDTRTFTILNTGTANLQLTGSPLVEITFTNNCTANITTQPAATVATSTTFTVSVDPIVATTFNFTLRIENSDFDEHPYVIQCQGTATPLPEISIEYQSTPVDDGDTITLGSYTAGLPAIMSFTIYNTGQAPLNLNGTQIVSFPTQNNVNCVLTSPPTSPVPVSGNSSFTVQFTPAGSGAWTFVLWVESNDPDENPYDITVDGTSPPVTPTRLGVFRQPGNANATVPFGVQPVVSVQDANGAVDTSDNTTVISVAIATGPSGASLGGTLTATCVNGYATFGGLLLSTEGTGYQLVFTTTGLTSTNSAAFDVGPAPSGSGGGGGGGDDDGGGCSTGGPGLPWLMLCALPAALALLLRLPEIS